MENHSHIPFQLVSANLPRRDDETNDTYGYRESDVKHEVQRASRLVCVTKRLFVRKCYLLIAFHFTFRPVSTASQEEQVLDVVYKGVKSRFIFLAAFKMIAPLNLLAISNRSVTCTSAQTHKTQVKLMNRMNCVTFARNQWANTIK